MRSLLSLDQNALSDAEETIVFVLISVILKVIYSRPKK